MTQRYKITNLEQELKDSFTFIGKGAFGCVIGAEYKDKKVVLKIQKRGTSTKTFFNELKSSVLVDKETLGASGWINTIGWSHLTDITEKVKQISTILKDNDAEDCLLDSTNPWNIIVYENATSGVSKEPKDLDDFLENQNTPLDARASRIILFQLIWAMHSAHSSLGLQHNDIKMSNIAVKLADTDQTMTFAIPVHNSKTEYHNFSIDLKKGDPIVTWIDMGAATLTTGDEKSKQFLNPSDVVSIFGSGPEYYLEEPRTNASDIWGIGNVAITLATHLRFQWNCVDANGNVTQVQHIYNEYGPPIVLGVFNDLEPDNFTPINLFQSPSEKYDISNIVDAKHRAYRLAQALGINIRKYDDEVGDLGAVDSTKGDNNPFKNISEAVKDGLGLYGLSLVKLLMTWEPKEREAFGLPGSHYGLANALFHPYFTVVGKYYKGVVKRNQLPDETSILIEPQYEMMQYRSQEDKDKLLKMLETITQEINATQLTLEQEQARQKQAEQEAKQAQARAQEAAKAAAQAAEKAQEAEQELSKETTDVEEQKTRVQKTEQKAQEARQELEKENQEASQTVQVEEEARKKLAQTQQPVLSDTTRQQVQSLDTIVELVYKDEHVIQDPDYGTYKGYKGFINVLEKKDAIVENLQTLGTTLENLEVTDVNDPEDVLFGLANFLQSKYIELVQNPSLKEFATQTVQDLQTQLNDIENRIRTVATLVSPENVEPKEFYYDGAGATSDYRVYLLGLKNFLNRVLEKDAIRLQEYQNTYDQWQQAVEKRKQELLEAEQAAEKTRKAQEQAELERLKLEREKAEQEQARERARELEQEQQRLEEEQKRLKLEAEKKTEILENTQGLEKIDILQENQDYVNDLIDLTSKGKTSNFTKLNTRVRTFVERLQKSKGVQLDWTKSVGNVENFVNFTDIASKDNTRGYNKNDFEDDADFKRTALVALWLAATTHAVYQLDATFDYENAGNEMRRLMEADTNNLDLQKEIHMIPGMENFVQEKESTLEGAQRGERGKAIPVLPPTVPKEKAETRGPKELMSIDNQKKEIRSAIETIYQKAFGYRQFKTKLDFDTVQEIANALGKFSYIVSTQTDSAIIEKMLKKYPVVQKPGKYEKFGFGKTTLERDGKEIPVPFGAIRTKRPFIPNNVDASFLKKATPSYIVSEEIDGKVDNFLLTKSLIGHILFMMDMLRVYKKKNPLLSNDTVQKALKRGIEQMVVDKQVKGLIPAIKNLLKQANPQSVGIKSIQGRALFQIGNILESIECNPEFFEKQNGYNWDAITLQLLHPLRESVAYNWSYLQNQEEAKTILSSIGLEAGTTKIPLDHLDTVEKQTRYLHCMSHAARFLHELDTEMSYNGLCLEELQTEWPEDWKL